MPSRRKIWSKVFCTEVVPAPDEPVTEMMGCCCDKLLAPCVVEQAALAEERRALAGRWRTGIVAGDPLDLVGGAEDQRRALMQLVRLQVPDSPRAVGGGTTGFLDQHGDRIGLVDQP